MTERRSGASYRFAAAIVRPLMMTLTKREWAGAEHLPTDRGFVACPNHVSYADPFTVAHFLHDHGCPPRFLAKEVLFRAPVVGRILTGAGQIPVYRETKDAGKALVAAVDAVRRGECVVIYPESTLTRDPALWPMGGKTGAARVALMTGCPVIPIAQWGPQDLLPPYGKLPHFVPRATIRIRAGAPVDLSAFAGRTLDVDTLRGATTTILDAMTGLLAEIRHEPVPADRWDPKNHDLPRTGNPKRGSARGRGRA